MRDREGSIVTARRIAAVSLAVSVTLAGCERSVVSIEETPLDDRLSGLLADANVFSPAAPIVANRAQVELGRLLFFDKELSGNRNISCGTCHTPLFATGDGISLSIGQGGTGLGPARQPNDADIIARNAPVIFNRNLVDVQFFDGRVQRHADGSLTTPAGQDLLPGVSDALAAVNMFPATDRSEMRGRRGDAGNELAQRADDDLRGIWSDLIARIVAIPEYVDRLRAAYPEAESVSDFTFAHAANALAAFQTDAFSALDSRFDRYLDGDRLALSEQEKRGAILFFGEAGCAGCHGGPLLSDFEFHNRAIPQLGPGKGDGPGGLFDFGRGRETGRPADRFQFRTPPLRNVAVSGPWFHDGAIADLEAAVRHELDCVSSARAYDPGQLAPGFAALYQADQMEEILAAIDPLEAEPVSLRDDQTADLVAFLGSLTSERIVEFGSEIPDRVPSGLPVPD